MATANLDIAEKLDIICKRGDSFNMTITMTDSAGQPIDLTSYTFSMEVKSKRVSNGRASGTTLPVVYEETILADGVITNSVTAASGQVTFTVDASTMKTIGPGVYVYDIQYENTANSEVRTILEGLFKVNPDVSLTT